jgi:hypothetical protein
LEYDLVELNNISEIEILPFDKDLAEQYFRKIFDDGSKQKKL